MFIIRSIAMAAVLASVQSAEDAETRIREARERSNRAIAERDLDTLVDLWTEDVHVVTSRSAVASGRVAEREAFAAEFRNRPDVSYVREPLEIEVFTPWGMASEIGRWTGRWREPDGIVEIGGTYLAKWQESDGRWRIRAEVFVPTRCSGSGYCSRRP